MASEELTIAPSGMQKAPAPFALDTQPDAFAPSRRALDTLANPGMCEGITLVKS